LENKIYCFGGEMTASIAPKATDTIMNMLDISTNIGSTADELKNKWVTISTNTKNLNIRPRYEPQTMLLPDGKTM
jgi:hypothetical protein